MSIIPALRSRRNRSKFVSVYGQIGTGVDKSVKTVKNHTKKKTTSYKEQNPEKVKEYPKQIENIPKDKLIYIAPRGKKVLGKISGHKFERTNIVAAQVNNKIIAPLQYKGMIYSAFFEEWFEKHLIPKLSKDAVIIMDNAAFHRKKRLNEIALKHRTFLALVKEKDM